MANKMFCFQCEQTLKGTGCTNSGVCGKSAEIASLQDQLTGELIGLARATQGTEPTAQTYQVIIEALIATATNVNFDATSLEQLIEEVKKQKSILVPRCETCEADCNRNAAYDLNELWQSNEDIRSLKSLILFGLRGMAAYAHHALILGRTDDTINAFFARALLAIGAETEASNDNANTSDDTAATTNTATTTHDTALDSDSNNATAAHHAAATPIATTTNADELLALVLELGQVNLLCMQLLDEANTGSYGTPEPTTVSKTIESGPFIVINGHDLQILETLLIQTADQGINVYTHGEMLPAHAYPELKKYPHLKGHFGTAWQNQQRELNDIPAPIIFTTNCLMPPRASFADRVFTTAMVAYPELTHITTDQNGKHDFSAVITKAHELGGYSKPYSLPGQNGGETLTTGFARGTVLSVADTVIEAVKAGAIKHFFLVGGCDGAKPERSYYTDFVKLTPADTIILTLACGKFRFNDLQLGEIGGLPRLMDMGQCNDAFSAIQVALALADAFGCSVNELPLTLVLSWYEQKAVAILLTLLALGIKNIYIGPSLPEFVSPNILQALVDGYNLTPISTPETDLAKMLG